MLYCLYFKGLIYKMNTKKINKTEYNEIYAALKLIENLYKNGMIKEHVYRNILKDHNDIIDISEFCDII